MRFSILAVVPLLLSAVSATYYVDCDNGKGNHEKYQQHLEPKKWSDCKRFSHGMKHFDCSKDDDYKYKFEFYQDDHCGGWKRERKHDGKKNEHKKYDDDKECWSYKVYCED